MTDFIVLAGHAALQIQILAISSKAKLSDQKLVLLLGFLFFLNLESARFSRIYYSKYCACVRMKYSELKGYGTAAKFVRKITFINRL